MLKLPLMVTAVISVLIILAKKDPHPEIRAGRSNALVDGGRLLITYAAPRRGSRESHSIRIEYSP
jgi:hypothetical protein